MVLTRAAVQVTGETTGSAVFYLICLYADFKIYIVNHVRDDVEIAEEGREQAE